MNHLRNVFLISLLAVLAGCAGSYRPASNTNSGTIIGSVIDQYTGQPIMGAVVRLAGSNYSATTDADGVFVIDDIPIGEYQLITSSLDYGLMRVNYVPVHTGTTTRVDQELAKGESEESRSYSSSVIKASPQKKTTQPATPDVATATIQGTITDSATGFPIVGASVNVVGSRAGGLTDVDGKFSIAHLPAGTLGLKITHVAYASTTVSGVNVQTGATVTVDRKLQSQEARHEQGNLIGEHAKSKTSEFGTIAGIVTDSATGKPITGASIQVVGVKSKSMPKFDGRYEIARIPAGAYKILADHFGYMAFESDSVVVKAGVTTKLDIKLKRVEGKAERDKAK